MLRRYTAAILETFSRIDAGESRDSDRAAMESWRSTSPTSTSAGGGAGKGRHPRRCWKAGDRWQVAILFKIGLAALHRRASDSGQLWCPRPVRRESDAHARVREDLMAASQELARTVYWAAGPRSMRDDGDEPCDLAKRPDTAVAISAAWPESE